MEWQQNNWSHNKINYDGRKCLCALRVMHTLHTTPYDVRVYYYFSLPVLLSFHFQIFKRHCEIKIVQPWLEALRSTCEHTFDNCCQIGFLLIFSQYAFVVVDFVSNIVSIYCTFVLYTRAQWKLHAIRKHKKPWVFIETILDSENHIKSLSMLHFVKLHWL